MRERALEVLAEPGTGAALDLEIKKTDGEHVLEGKLVSQETGRAFPIIGGVPRFGRRAMPRAVKTAGTFESITGLSAAELDGRWCFDAGCGDGGRAAAAAKLGAKVVAMTGADACEGLAKAHPDVDFVQGDLLEPPVRPGTFDVSYAIDIVQTTTDPKRAAHLAVTAARDDGTFCLTVPADPRFASVADRVMQVPLLREAASYAMALSWREVEMILRAAGAKEWRFFTKAPVNVVGLR